MFVNVEGVLFYTNVRDFTEDLVAAFTFALVRNLLQDPRFMRAAVQASLRFISIQAGRLGIAASQSTSSGLQTRASGSVLLGF